MRKLLKERDLPQGHRDTEAEEILMGDTPRDLYGCEYKGVAGEGICKFLKKKVIKIERWAVRAKTEWWRGKLEERECEASVGTSGSTPRH